MPSKCELCGTRENVKQCKCSDCLQESADGRALCKECANNIYED